jgi:hypothetical protein
MLPAKISDWRAKLSTKAKQEKRFRFYSLYGLISHAETLKGAWNQVRANGGAAGVDRISIEQIERQGPEQWLEALGQELQKKTYRCEAVRRVYIPKANGKLRPLGIPTVRDRVVQAAVLLILEPIFEADFEDCSYGFRPGRNAHQAMEKIRENLRAGKCEIYDADLEGYFDSIPHDKLMACVRMRVVDGSVLKLISQWLKAPVVEEDQAGGKKIGRNRSGTPQGGVLTPRTQSITCSRLVLVASWDRNRMLDGQSVAVNNDLLNDQPDDLLPLNDFQLLCRLSQSSQEILHWGVQLRQPAFLQGLQSNSFKFLFYGGLSAPQFRCSASQIAQSDQVLLISIQ